MNHGYVTSNFHVMARGRKAEDKGVPKVAELDDRGPIGLGVCHDKDVIELYVAVCNAHAVAEGQRHQHLRG